MTTKMKPFPLGNEYGYFLGDFMPTIENEGASVIEFDLSALKSKCASNNK